MCFTLFRRWGTEPLPQAIRDYFAVPPRGWLLVAAVLGTMGTVRFAQGSGWGAGLLGIAAITAVLFALQERQRPH